MSKNKIYDMFGSAVSQSLTASGRNQVSLADELGCSTAYVNQIMTGAKMASPGRTNSIVSALKMSPEQKSKLHLAAAQRFGFEINVDLVKDK